MKRLLIYPLTLIAMLACTAQMSQSTLVLPSSLGYMTEKADTIVNGIIRDSYGYWENKVIYTGIHVDVLEYLKSADPARPQRIELKVMGGRVGDSRLRMDSAPRFKPGEEVLLFLIRHGDRYQVYGFYYGVCRVSTGPDGVSKQVTGPIFSNREVRNLRTHKVQLNALPPGGEKLADFVQRIRKLIESQ